MTTDRRKPENSWLTQYPGLHVNRQGTFYVRHTVTRKQASLGTKDRVVAIRRWRVLSERWEAERQDWQTDALVDKLATLSTPRSEGDHTLLSDYLRLWRENILGHSIVDGRVVLGECLVLSLRGHREGKPIAPTTRTDYANDVRQLEARKEAQFPLSDPDILRKSRKLLAPWLNKPTHYNGLRNSLSRVFAHAVQEGIIDRNPIIDIGKAREQKREVLIPDEVYQRITELLCKHKHNRRIMDGTWRAKICDLMYMMSQQPIDVFNIKEAQGEIYAQPVMVDEYEVYGVIRFARHKTAIGIELEMNKELAELWQWFIDFKREQEIISEYLMVYPRYFDKRSRAKPVRHRTMQAAWREACEDAGFSGEYQLRDLRKKGLTDEFVSQGENDKGGHETEAMRKHYRLIVPPKRARSTLGQIGGARTD